MTLFVVLLFGLGTVLIVSGYETDPATGKSVSIWNTVQLIWAGEITFAEAPPLPVKPLGGSPIPPSWYDQHAASVRVWTRSQGPQG